MKPRTEKSLELYDVLSMPDGINICMKDLETMMNVKIIAVTIAVSIIFITFIRLKNADITHLFG